MCERLFFLSFFRFEKEREEQVERSKKRKKRWFKLINEVLFLTFLLFFKRTYQSKEEVYPFLLCPRPPLHFLSSFLSLSKIDSPEKKYKKKKKKEPNNNHCGGGRGERYEKVRFSSFFSFCRTFWGLGLFFFFLFLKRLRSFLYFSCRGVSEGIVCIEGGRK